MDFSINRNIVCGSDMVTYGIGWIKQHLGKSMCGQVYSSYYIGTGNHNSGWLFGSYIYLVVICWVPMIIYESKPKVATLVAITLCHSISKL